jgi:large subunit ribosomal protein L22
MVRPMEVTATAKSVRVSPRKMRLIADSMRNRHIDDANRLLEIMNKRAARIFQKTLRSAVANAVNNAKLETNNLLISGIIVNESQAFKRFRPSTRGRIHPYKKRGSHLTIILKEKVVIKSVAPKAVAKKEDKKDEKKGVTK